MGDRGRLIAKRVATGLRQDHQYPDENHEQAEEADTFHGQLGGGSSSLFGLDSIPSYDGCLDCPRNKDLS